MDSKNSSNEKVIGVVGVGSFGTAIANMLAEKNNVIVYARKPEVVSEINNSHTAQGKKLDSSILATNDPKDICQR